MMNTNRFPLGVVILALVLMLVVWGLLAYPSFLKPLAVKLEARTRTGNQAIMIIYAEELDIHLRKTQQPLAQVGLLWLNSLLEKKVSPYPVAFGPVRVISCDDQGRPLDTNIAHLCSQIGYYTDGQVYKLVVWGEDNQVVHVFRN